MPWVRRLAAPLLLLSLAGCGVQQPPIDIAAISAVQNKIKQQLLVYMLAAEKRPIKVRLDGPDGPETNLRDLTPEQRRKYFWCGDGSIDYDIKSIKAQLQTSLVQSVGGSIGFTVPVPIAPSGTFSFTRQAMNSQTLDFTQWAIPYGMQSDALHNEPPPTDEEIRAAPIALVLLNLRYAQIGAALKVDPLTGLNRNGPEACLTNFNLAKPSEDPKNTFTLALTVSVQANGSVSVGVAAAKIGVSGGGSTTTGHTLTVTFAQRDLDGMQAVRDIVDKKCAGAAALTSDCKKSQAAYAEVVKGAMTGAQVSPEALRTLGLSANESTGGRLPGSSGVGIMKRMDTPLQ